MCGNCANWNKLCKSIGECVYANKRSVSLYTVKIRNSLENRLGKKVVFIVLSTEEDCPLKTGKEPVVRGISKNDV